MSAVDKIDDEGNVLVSLRSDPAPLIEALHESIRRKTGEIDSMADAEIESIENETACVIEEFRAAEQMRFDEVTAYEEGKAANLLSIEMKKMKLEVMESFIRSIMSSAADALRRDERYPEFLVRCAVSPLGEIEGSGATVHISPGDRFLTDVIMNEVKSSGFRLSIRIVEDDKILSGGAMVADDQSDVIFNNTVERIIYRRSDEIRRVIVRSLNELLKGAEDRE